MKNKFLVAIMLGLLAGFMTFSTTFAQEGAGDNTAEWGEFFDADGQLLPGVIDNGEVTIPMDGMPELPFGIAGQGTFHEYTSSDGSTMLLPDASTLFFMAMNSDDRLLGADSGIAIGEGHKVMTAADLLADPSGTLSNLLGTDFSSLLSTFTPEFADALISGNNNVWSMLGYNDANKIFSLLANSTLDDQNLYLAALLYNSCSTSPTGCPSELCAGNPEACGLAALGPFVPHVIVECPGATVQQQSPNLSIKPIAPPFPVVIGQDETRRGVDITAGAMLPPVIYTWHEPIYRTQTVCRPLRSGETGANCRTTATGWRNNGKLEDRRVLSECRPHVEYLPEQILGVTATANIDSSTVEWIKDYLGSTWYGAKVYRPFFNLAQFASISAGCQANGTCTAILDARQIPFADPGQFNLVIRVNTAGAYFNGVQITRPRVLNGSGEAHINVLLPTLIDAQ